MEGDILVVDDNPKNIEILINFLERERYEVRPIRNSTKVLDAMRAQKPDLVLLDIMMPEINGFEVCEQIKANNSFSNIPVIFISALTDTSDKLEGFKRGGVDYITKPFRHEEVIARVKTHLSLYKLTTDLQRQVQKEVQKQKNQEKLLMQQSKMASVGNLISAIAHQWKQPLNAISMISEMMVYQSEYNPDEVIDFGKQIKEQADFMNDTIQTFREFLKPSKEKKEFLACDTVLQIKKMFGDVFLKNNVEVIIHDRQHFQTLGYETEFKQVILNILINAVDAFDENGVEKKDKKIECFFEKRDHKNIIKIRDNAGGINKKLLPDKLFEPYTSSKGDKGTGIGLQIAKSIIEEHMNGKLWAQNADEGAEFIIELPDV
ncbi:MAG: hybrid sensor histidine kinase/response regulator [Leptospiraceae bacterium]|nr:hybrid sensor histidine kinase/response regulator [Leptospiraceae bacterium]